MLRWSWTRPEPRSRRRGGERGDSTAAGAGAAPALHHRTPRRRRARSSPSFACSRGERIRPLRRRRVMFGGYEDPPQVVEPEMLPDGFQIADLPLALDVLHALTEEVAMHFPALAVGASRDPPRWPPTMTAGRPPGPRTRPRPPWALRRFGLLRGRPEPLAGGGPRPGRLDPGRQERARPCCTVGGAFP